MLYVGRKKKTKKKKISDIYTPPGVVLDSLKDNFSSLLALSEVFLSPIVIGQRRFIHRARTEPSSWIQLVEIHFQDSRQRIYGPLV